MVAALLVIHTAAAEPERLDVAHESRLWTSADGLPATTTRTVDQDERGFLWVTTAEGVARFDGDNVTRMTGPGVTVVRGSGAADRVVVVDGEGVPAELVRRDHLRALSVPVEPPIPGGVRLDRRGRVWLAADRVWVEAAPHTFREVPGPWADGSSPDGAGPRLVGADGDGAVFVEAAGRLGRVTDAGWTDLGPSVHALAAVARADGSVLITANDPTSNDHGVVTELRDGRARRLFGADWRAIDLVTDGVDVYLSNDQGVYRIDASGASAPLVRGSCCGTALVDREGGLWIAGELGLRHVPSPRTASWPSATIRVYPAPDGLWTPTWGGMRRLHYASGALEATSWTHPAAAACPDPRGDVWTLGRSTTRRYRADAEPEELPGAGVSGVFHGCARGGDGRTWFASPFGLLVSDPADPVPHQVAGAPPAVDGVTPWSISAVGEVDGVVVYGALGHLCRASVDRVLTTPDAGWSCEVLPPPAQVVDLAATGGEIWAAVRQLGVLRAAPRSGGWTPIPASAALRTGTLGLLTPSARGGVWVLAEGDVIRVESDDEEPGGWRVLERLGAAQGVRREVTPREIVETDALWLLTVDGAITRIAADARAPAEAPPVYLVQTRTEAGVHDPAVPLVLEAARNLVELQFAAPVFGRRGELQYRFRLRPADPWSPPSRDATLRLAALGTGQYRAEVQASLDGQQWSEVPAAVAFRVRAPWYLRAPFLLGCAAVLVGGGWVAHRTRLRAAVQLERQRARIARDLHDEIGSGLGSIGVLAGVAARYPGEARSAELVARIAGLVAELGRGLTDIVTSLRGGAANLQALHGHIVERGTAACAAGRPRFEAQVTESVPAVPLSVPVRINTFLIAVEAIHNAVRHANAEVVTLDLRRVGRRTWQLSITDDGVGLSPVRGRTCGGAGLRSMAERADEIGAKLSMSTRSSGGTEVILRFDPAAEERR